MPNERPSPAPELRRVQVVRRDALRTGIDHVERALIAAQKQIVWELLRRQRAHHLPRVEVEEGDAVERRMGDRQVVARRTRT